MDSQKEEKYTLEYLMELLGGFQYYSRNQIYYTYHALNGNEKEAEYFLELCKEENKPIEKALNKLQSKE